MIELLRVFFASRDMLDKLKSGKPVDQEMLERLDRAVSLVKFDEMVEEGVE
jgi:hypothetical protein